VNFCSNCHGQTPSLSIRQNADTPAELDAANRNIGAMNSLVTRMTQQDVIDVAAYLASLR
jgi:cytochrome c553